MRQNRTSGTKVSPRRAARILVGFCLSLPAATAQQPPAPQLPDQPIEHAPTFPLASPTIPPPPSPLAKPTLSPAILFLFDLESRFAASVAAGGGKAFASWFADDAVTLNNGRPAVLGRGNIAAQTTWSATAYQLTWTPQGAQMLPSNDAGYTWGHYEGHSLDQHGEAIVTSGRYITLWKKTPDGTWKVALDASANEPPDAGSCCVLPKP